ncbi:MAG: hypothetical protein WCK77_21875 [Verrucomicrobiota bacterium]
MDKKTHNAAPTSTTDTRYYRFGLSGLSSGGKTCLLAALGLPRVAHPNGLTAIPLPVPKMAARHLKDGRAWLDIACEALSKGGVPPPTVFDNIGQLTLRYKFTDGCQREAFVELVDYSGELLDSSLSQSDLAGQLRRYLAEVDGFLFVAEHPKAGESAGDLASYLHHLREALALLRDETNGSGNAPATPIALLVNKWDRGGPLSRTPNAHDEEVCKLKAFLESEPLPPHAGLLADLTAASWGECRAFPVSAFGEAVSVPSDRPGEYIEKPAQVTPELPSFGIEEPFLWLIQQRDRCDADALEAASRRWSLWFSPWRSRRCSRNAKRLATRMSVASPEISRVQRVQTRLKRRFGAHVLWLVLIYLLGDMSLDVIHFRQARAAMGNPADKDGWTNAEAWFTNYAEASPLRHVLHRRFILSNDAASEKLLSARTLRDETLWNTVTDCQDPAARVRLADDYIRAFPQGVHRSAALKLLTEAETGQARRQLRAQLEALQSRLDGLMAEVSQAEKSQPPDFKSVSDKLPSLDRDVKNVPDMKVADEPLSKKWLNIVAGVGAIRAKIAGPVAAGEKRKKYYDLVKGNKWVEAGDELAGLPAEYSDLRTHFRDNVMPQVEAGAMKVLGWNGAGWNESLVFVKEFRTLQLRPLLPEGARERMDELVTGIKQKGDRYMYSSCSDLGGSIPFSNYLDNAPLGSMREVVQNWLHFIDLRERKNTYRVGISRIKWGDKAKNAASFYNTENRIWISVGEAIKKSTLWDNRKGDYKPNDREKFAVEVRGVLAGDQQTVSLKLWYKGRYWDYSLGDFELKSSIEGLQDLTRDLKGSEYGPNTATLWVEVFDNGHWREFKRPALPPWTAPK